jgi:non-ribosomal peptide synthetase component F
MSAQEQVNGIVPIGKQMPGTTTVVIDSEGNVCPDGEKGELCLLGAQVMSGYWRDEEKTRRAFVEIDLNGSLRRAYRTGDISFVNKNGNLIYCGRMDAQVKIDGHRIELGEIEHHGRQFIGSSKVAVIVKAL